MNFGMACAPWAFGVLADYAGTNIAIGIGIGFSLLACVANAPLMWHPLMGKPKPKPPVAQRKLPDEDSELFEHILEGDVVDPEMAFEINRDRGMHGKPSVVPRVKPYSEEKDHLKEIAQGAGDTFRFRMELYDRVLAGLAQEGSDPENYVFSKVRISFLPFFCTRGRSPSHLSRMAGGAASVSQHDERRRRGIDGQDSERLGTVDGSVSA